MVRDHINGDKLDNRSCNLRPATRKQNTYNRKKTKSRGGKHKTNYIGVDFVYWSKTPKWRARINNKSIGLYKTEIEAAKARDKAVKEQRSNFGVYNFK